MIQNNFALRHIRSFVRRDGRMTAAQRRVLEELWPLLGLERDQGPADFDKIFRRNAPRILEIGFGSGASLLQIAAASPECDFIGIETYQPGVGSLLLGIESAMLTNIRVYYADAVLVLKHCIPANSLDGLQIFFPDPWQKRRHHKRRLIQPEFINAVLAKMKPGAILHLATDWEDYAHKMMQVLSHTPQLINLAGENQYAERSAQRPVVTKFEGRGERHGRPIWELQFAVKAD